jgi:hypothetical protein
MVGVEREKQKMKSHSEVTLDKLNELDVLFSGPERWVQGMWAADAGGNYKNPESKEACRWCLGGALIYVTNDLGLTGNLSYELGSSPFIGNSNLIEWNDEPQRTFEDIKALIAETIQRVKGRS